MFTDYYAILEIQQGATAEQVREAYKKQVRIWHPDVNKSTNATARMQKINEAYLILKDAEARQLYDGEFNRYKSFMAMSFKTYNEPSGKEQTTSPHFEVYDATLLKWMANARQQGAELVKKSMEDLIGISKASGTAMANEFFPGLVRLIVFSVIVLILVKTCN
jgi:curved DNA-binding protein CbpA